MPPSCDRLEKARSEAPPPTGLVPRVAESTSRSESRLVVYAHRAWCALAAKHYNAGQCLVAGEGGCEDPQPPRPLRTAWGTPRGREGTEISGKCLSGRRDGRPVTWRAYGKCSSLRRVKAINDVQHTHIHTHTHTCEAAAAVVTKNTHIHICTLESAAGEAAEAAAAAAGCILFVVDGEGEDGGGGAGGRIFVPRA